MSVTTFKDVPGGYVVEHNNIPLYQVRVYTYGPQDMQYEILDMNGKYLQGCTSMEQVQTFIKLMLFIRTL